MKEISLVIFGVFGDSWPVRGRCRLASVCASYRRRTGGGVKVQEEETEAEAAFGVLGAEECFYLAG